MRIVLLNTVQFNSKKGFMAVVDDEDYHKVSKYNWYVRNYRKTFYADAHIGKKRISMHRLIMNAPEGMLVDHINGSGLDNRKENLRLCTNSQNLMNRDAVKNNLTGLKGVEKNGHGFSARIRVDNKKYYLGQFKTKEQAAKAYNVAALKYHGEFAKLNVIN